jgi:hypothetical protein
MSALVYTTLVFYTGGLYAYFGVGSVLLVSDEDRQS